MKRKVLAIALILSLAVAGAAQTRRTSDILQPVRVDNTVTATIAGVATDAKLDSIIDRLTAIETAVESTDPVAVNLQATTSGGATPGSWLSNNSDTEIIIKASPGMLYGLEVTNSLAAKMYVRAYNLTNPDCTSTTGIVGRWIIPASATGAGMAKEIVVGRTFSTGISLCVTTTVSDTNNTAIGSAEAAVSYAYN